MAPQGTHAAPVHPAQPNAERVSVVMPVFNAEATLARAIDSVLGQSFPSLELIVVDDGSSDGSWGIVEAYARRDPRVRPVGPRANGGVARARNAGLEAAAGTHVAFLDSDDWWHPRKLEAQLATMRESEAAVCYAAYQRVDERGNPLSLVRPPTAIRYTDLLKSNYIGHSTGIYRRDIADIRFQQIGHEDYAFWLGLVHAAGRAVAAAHPEALAYYTVRADSLSASKWSAAWWQWRIYRDVAGLGPIAAARHMMHYALRAVLKRRSG